MSLLLGPCDEDADDTLSDLVVYVYGDFFETFAAVDENGNFEFAAMLDDEAWGFEYAIACDLQSAWSNVREDAVQPT